MSDGFAGYDHWKETEPRAGDSCPRCDDTGVVPCPTCGGEGVVSCDDGTDECPACEGRLEVDCPLLCAATACGSCGRSPCECDDDFEFDR